MGWYKGDFFHEWISGHIKKKLGDPNVTFRELKEAGKPDLYVYGAVVGWTTYFILRRAQPKALSGLSTIIGILGGATIIGLFDPKGPTFAGYALGLAGGFFGYYLVYLKIVGKKPIRDALKKDLEQGKIVMEADHGQVNIIMETDQERGKEA